MKKDSWIFWLIVVFVVYMHFEGFIKLLFDYTPAVQGFKYVFSFAFFSIWVFKIGIPKSKLSWPMFFLFLLTVIQFLNPLVWEGNGLVLSMIGALYYVAYLPLFFICFKILDLDRTKKLLVLILVLVSLSAVIAHYQYSVGWRAYVRQYPWKLAYTEIWQDPEWISIRNFVFHGPMAFDCKPPRYWYASGIIISFAFVFSFSIKKYMYPVYIILALNASVALFTSGYRFALLATVIGLFIMLLANLSFLLKKFRVWHLIIGAVALVVLIAAAVSYIGIDEYNRSRYERLLNPIGEYINQRGYTWLGIISNAEKLPFGSGLRGGSHFGAGSFGVSAIWQPKGDNWLLTLSAEAGVLAMIAVLVIYYRAAREFLTNLFTLKALKRSLSIGCFAMLVIFIFEVGFLPGEGPSYWMFWVFSGILFKLKEMKE
jgi:hypothetical protein